MDAQADKKMDNLPVAMACTSARISYIQYFKIGQAPIAQFNLGRWFFMSATLLDYKTSQPSNVQGAGTLPGGVAIPAAIATAPAVTKLADIGIYSTVAPNRVELEATVGVQGTTGNPKLSFTVLRDGVQIFQTTQGLETSYEQFYTVTFEAMDYGVAAGFHTYVLQVSNPTAGTTANVSGPVLFTGTAYLIS